MDTGRIVGGLAGAYDRNGQALAIGDKVRWILDSPSTYVVRDILDDGFLDIVLDRTVPGRVKPGSRVRVRPDHLVKRPASLLREGIDDKLDEIGGRLDSDVIDMNGNALLKGDFVLWHRPTQYGPRDILCIINSTRGGRLIIVNLIFPHTFYADIDPG